MTQERDNQSPESCEQIWGTDLAKPLVMRILDQCWYLLDTHMIAGKIDCIVVVLAAHTVDHRFLSMWIFATVHRIRLRCTPGSRGCSSSWSECRVIQGLHSATPTVSSSKPLNTFQCRTVGVLESRLQSTGRDKPSYPRYNYWLGAAQFCKCRNIGKHFV